MASGRAAPIHVSATDLNPTVVTKNGSSWGSAYRTISEGVEAAANSAPAGTVTEIWIAKGTYQMNCNKPLPNNVNIYGGFAGTERQIDSREFTGNFLPPL